MKNISSLRSLEKRDIEHTSSTVDGRVTKGKLGVNVIEFMNINIR